MIEAIEKKWSVVWVTKWTLRVLRCMPWSKWGYDPVEKEKK
jgi:putative component of membrane protein insertase Oxa1/YidC/SpoIIIJ protein YidD